MSIVITKFAKNNAYFAILIGDSCIFLPFQRKTARKSCKMLFSAILLFVRLSMM